MLVFHALWSSAPRVCLWAEDSTRPALVPGRRGRPARVSGPRPHPFACGTQALQKAVADLGGEATLKGFGRAATKVELTVLLPSHADGPLPSPELLRGDETIGTGTRARLRPWRVPTVAFEPDLAVDLLLRLPEQGEAGVRVGSSVAFLSNVIELALELVAAGRVVPALVRSRGVFSARWRPVPYPEDTQRLRLLVESIPPICRAELVEGAVDGQPPGDVVRDCFEGVVDAAVRSALRGHSLLPSRRERIPPRASIAEAWLTGLTATDPMVRGKASELAGFQQRIEGWQRAAIPVSSPLRTCFRLVPPNGESRPEQTPDARQERGAGGGQAEDGQGQSTAWSLEFLLQAKDDPSLLVSAAEVWRAKKRLRVFERTQDNPQERLLEDLGRASRLYPELEQALRVARPVALALEPAGAHRFLTQAVPPLTQAGFGVLVPPWWHAPGIRLGVQLRARPRSPGGDGSGLLGLEGVCDYRWELALGEEPLSIEELRELARLKAPLVRVRGRWVELRSDQIEAALALFERQARGGEGALTVAEVLRTGLGLLPSATGLPVVGVQAEGWVGEILKGAIEERLKPTTTPAGFQGTLRPYQERGLAWLSFLGGLGLGACLADDMGLGKTVVLLALLVAERERTERSSKPTLLVCPMSIIGNWQREAERFAPGLVVHVHHGGGRLSGDILREAAVGADLVITSYALAARDLQALAGVEWGRIVLDEAQNIKNASAKQTQAVRSLRAPERVALTGTPVENRLSELWSILEFCNSGLLGSASAFRTRFAIPVERYRDEAAADLLKRVTAPFILRRLKTDRAIIADLPDKVEMKVFCNITREQATLYQAILDEMLVRIEQSEGIERKGLVLATMMKLKQVCNHPAHLLGDRSRLEGRSGKLARLEEILEEVLAEGDRALCFTQFAEMGQLLKAYLQERFRREACFLHGGTPKRARDEMVARFQSGDGPPLFILSLKAGGTGLNLTAANHVIHFDRWWNPAVEDQATDRAFRIGQRRDVQVRKLICIGTLEERIDRMIEQKHELAARIVGAGENWLTELSTAEVRAIVALSADAVAEA